MFFNVPPKKLLVLVFSTSFPQLLFKAVKYRIPLPFSFNKVMLQEIVEVSSERSLSNLGKNLLEFPNLGLFLVLQDTHNLSLTI